MIGLVDSSGRDSRTRTAKVTVYAPFQLRGMEKRIGKGVAERMVKGITTVYSGIRWERAYVGLVVARGQAGVGDLNRPRRHGRLERSMT
jgi:hypothetical protein